MNAWSFLRMTLVRFLAAGILQGDSEESLEEVADLRGERVAGLHFLTSDWGFGATFKSIGFCERSAQTQYKRKMIHQTQQDRPIVSWSFQSHELLPETCCGDLMSRRFSVPIFGASFGGVWKV